MKIYEKIKRALIGAEYVTTEARELAKWKRIAIFFMVLKGIDLLPYVLSIILYSLK